MIVASMRQLLGMWGNKFDFVPLTLAEAEALDDRIVSPDSDSAQLLKKALGPRCWLPQLCTAPIAYIADQRSCRSLYQSQETYNPGEC